MHPGGGDELAVLLAVGGEADAAVEEHFEVGPYVFEVRLAAYFNRWCVELSCGVSISSNCMYTNP